MSRAVVATAFALSMLFATSVCAAGFADQGFVRGAIRTEYDDGKGLITSPLSLRYASAGKEGCLWDAQDPFNYWGCPGRAPFAGSIAQPWLGLVQNRDACGDPASARSAETWTACIAYAQSKLFAVNWQPGQDYWVAVANSDPSLDQCNLGPPNLSWPILNPSVDTGPSYFKIASDASGTKRRARLAINAFQFSHRCRNNPVANWFYTIPFLSIGAQQGRGQSTPILTFNRRRDGDLQSDLVSFDVAVLNYQEFGCRAGSSEICRGGGTHAGVWMISSWGNKRRAVFVEFLSEGILEYTGAPLSRRWAWPIGDSFIYPGLDIAYMNSDALARDCGMDFPRMRAAAPTSTQLRRYSISPSAVFTCASLLGLFEVAMPDQLFELNGFHWFIESAGTSGVIELALENMVAEQGSVRAGNVCPVSSN